MQKAVNLEKIGVDVGRITKLRNGDLVLTIQNGSGKREILKREIIDHCSEATTSFLTRKKIILIKRIAITATTVK